MIHVHRPAIVFATALLIVAGPAWAQFPPPMAAPPAERPAPMQPIAPPPAVPQLPPPAAQPIPMPEDAPTAAPMPSQSSGPPPDGGSNGADLLPTNGPSEDDAAANNSLDQAPTNDPPPVAPAPASSGDVSFWMIALIVLAVVVGVVFWLRRSRGGR